MLHIKVFESYNNLAEIELIPVEEAPLYKAFDIHVNNRKVGIIDVGLYNTSLTQDEAEIVGININKESRGLGIGALSVRRLFKRFPNVRRFILMPTEDSLEFWKSVGAKNYGNGYLYLER